MSKKLPQSSPPQSPEAMWQELHRRVRRKDKWLALLLVCGALIAFLIILAGLIIVVM